MRLIPQNNENPKKGKLNIPSWFNSKDLKTKAENEAKANADIKVSFPNDNKTIVISYRCDACLKSYADANLDPQKKLAAKNGQNYITCPQCNGALRVERTAIVPNKRMSGVNTRDVYQVKPGRIPNSWIDKAVYGRMVSQLEKFCDQMGIDNKQVRFQRGIRTTSGGITGPKSAEFSIDFFDEANTRNRIYAEVGITPEGHFVPPTTFHVASGREYPFTKESLDEITGSKLYDAAEPYVPQPHIMYKQPDITNWPFAWSKNVKKMQRKSSKKMAAETKDLVQQGIDFYKSTGMDPMTVQQKITEDLQQGGVQPTTQDLVKDIVEKTYGQSGLQTALSMKLVPVKTTIDDYVRVVKNANYPESEKELFENTEVINAFKEIPESKLATKKFTLLRTYNYVIAVKHPKDIALKAALTAVKYSAIRPEVYDVVMRSMEDGESFEEAATKAPGLTPEEWNEAADLLLEKSKGEVTGEDQIWNSVLQRWTPRASTKVVAAADMGGLYQPTQKATPFQPGKIVEYQGQRWEVIGQRKDGIVILAPENSPAGTGQVYVPIQKQTEITDTGEFKVTSKDEGLLKQALRDKDTYMPLVEPDPEYSLAEQTQQSEAKFDVPYSEMDQGVLPDDKRNYTKMFRGSSLSLKGGIERISLSLKIATIKHENGKWNVYSESGKHMGGPYNSKEEAVKRLRQIEFFKHKKGTDIYRNEDKHEHPYKPKTEKYPEPCKEEMDEFIKEHPKHASIKKTAEPTGYKENDGKEKESGWPVTYDRVKDMLQSQVRQNRVPIPGLDLHALKDNKYTRAELIDFLEALKVNGEDAAYPPSTASNESMKKLAEEEVANELNLAIEDEIKGQEEYAKLIEMVNDPLSMRILEDIKADEAKHEGDLREVKDVEEKEGPKEEMTEDKQENPFPASKEASVKTAEDEYAQRPSGILVPKELEEELQPESVMEKEIPVSFKEYKKAPHGLGGEIPTQATPEMVQTYDQIKHNRNLVVAIDNTINQMKLDLQKQIEEAKKSGSYNENVEATNTSIRALANLMSKAKVDLVAVEDKIVNLYEQKLKVPSDLTAAAKVELLLKHFGEAAEKVLDEAQKQVVELAEKLPTTTIHTLREYPARKPKASVQAAMNRVAFLDIMQQFQKTIENLLNLIQRTDIQAEQLELTL